MLIELSGRRIITLIIFITQLINCHIICTKDNTDLMFLIIGSDELKGTFHFSISTYNAQYFSSKMSRIKRLVSVKGKSMMLYKGYICTVERTTTTKLILRCQNRDY